MKTNNLRNLLLREVQLYQNAYRNKDFDLCMIHLGRAHIVSQNKVSFHLYVHYLMLQYAFLRHDLREILGQVLRLIVTIPGHLLGRVPAGNTGWSTVGLIQKMPVPKDLEVEFSLTESGE